MGICFRRSLQVWSLLASVSVLSRAQQPARPLITRPIDEAQLVTLHGNKHPLAQPQFDLGQASPDLPMQRMLLVLKRSPQQDSALRKLLDNQQDKTSSNYHKWLTPDEFGNRFGNSDQDIQLVMAWLQAHGFQVNHVSRGRSLIEFSGVEAQVEETFHTQIHRYMLANGEQHSANASDPQIPAALAPAVAGVWTLHDFYKKPQLVISKQQVSGRAVFGSRPQLTSGSGQNALAPQIFTRSITSARSLGADHRSRLLDARILMSRTSFGFIIGLTIRFRCPMSSLMDLTRAIWEVQKKSRQCSIPPGPEQSRQMPG